MNTTRASLLARLKDREESQDWRAFDAIYRPLLFQYARAWGLQGADADEVAQECLLAFWKHLARFDYDPQRGRFRAWLQKLVENRIKNRARRRRELQAESADLRRLLETGPPEDVFESLWLREHMRFYLEQIRRQVEPQTYRAFEKHVLEEQSVEAVCSELGITPNQVYKSKWRITQKLTEMMQWLEQ